MKLSHLIFPDNKTLRVVLKAENEAEQAILNMCEHCYPSFDLLDGELSADLQFGRRE